MKRLTKKASLEVGVSTIVILVIAMVLIGGGIAFIRGFLKKGTDSLNQAFDITEFTNQPDANNPVVFAQGNTISIKKDTKKTVKIGIYNNEGKPNTFKFNISSCTYGNSGESFTPYMVSNDNTVNPGEGRVFNVFIYGNKEESGGKGAPLDAGDYLCTVKAMKKEGNSYGDYATTDLVLGIYN